ncbi:MAG: hypothetical protein IJ420_00555 [Lachnospiraceae bacterium]|nr:hypothetical protein [Lachnospiraceae bacterium]MBQ8632079.1 hypothetical protein [Lachnospiraceae bacterium]
MNKYETLLDAAEQDGITVTEKFDLSETRFKGLYCDGTIAIDRDIRTDTEKAGILAEELGHHHTTYGNILDLHNVSDIKQEGRARLWAYDKLIGLTGIVAAYKHGCKSLHETAEFLEVTEVFLNKALETYRNKYGCYVAVDNYVIYFTPVLGVLEIL